MNAPLNAPFSSNAAPTSRLRADPLAHQPGAAQLRWQAAATLASGALIVGLCLCSPAQAASASATAPAWASFTQALHGDEAAMESAAATFAQLNQTEPGDVVLLAYAGASHTLLARTTFLPWKKMKYAEDGLAQIDKALALLTPAHEAPAYRQIPAVLDVKFTAASTFLALPGMFHRQERGQKLLAEVAASPLLKSCPAPFQAAVATAQQKARGG